MASTLETLMSPAQLVAPSGSLKVTSPAFADKQRIPDRHTLYGENVAPALSWSGASPEAKGFALLCTDPDAMRVAGKEWVHWAVVDLPANTTSIPEGGKLPPGARELKNDFGKTTYGGPRPPSGSGVHHYIFALYALRSDASALKPGATLAEIRKFIVSRAIDQASLVGTFDRS